MVQENELVMLVLGIGVFIFTQRFRGQIKRIPQGHLFIAGFNITLIGWMLTVLEGFFWESALNLLEHFCYSVSAILLAIWCWKISCHGKIVR